MLGCSRKLHNPFLKIKYFSFTKVINFGIRIFEARRAVGNAKYHTRLIYSTSIIP